MKWLLAFLIFAALPVHAQKTEKATFAAGCFWCTEEAFEGVPGVVSAVSGYIGGTTKNPTYEQISTGRTGHTEAVEVTFDPAKVSYEKLLDVFWVNHDPTVTNRQFCDSGSQYRPEIFYHSEEQKIKAQKVRAEVEESGKWKSPVVTEITAAGTFFDAEAYHQDYLQKNPNGYTCHFWRA